MLMELIVEIELDVVEHNDWGWNITTIVLDFHGFFMHRGHRFLPAIPPVI